LANVGSDTSRILVASNGQRAMLAKNSAAADDARYTTVLLFEKLVTSKFESTLEEIAGGCGTEAGQQCASPLFRDDLTEATSQALIVCDGIELYPSLDAESKAVSTRLDDPQWKAPYTSTGVRPP